ncbi:hypothetical protein [Streptomyces sp. NPDC096132]|uniref:hypothetical protein n=1 Tax=Streptomyces sp. NPDC096132 TaxID=3366075 RepID=UPI00380AFEB8
MSYSLRAVITGEDVLRDIVREIPAARSAPLAQGLSLLPVTEDVFDSVTTGDSTRPLGFWWLPGGFDGRLAAWSTKGPVAFVEADFFGGVGEQRAAVWAGGRLVLGPLVVEEGAHFPPAGSPISRALRRLGATAPPGQDEFSALDLGRHRHSEAWIS